MKKKLKSVFLMGFSLALLLFSGCEIFKKASQPCYLISIHDIVQYPRASKIEKEMPQFSGGTIWVNASPRIHSDSILEIETVPNKEHPGYFDLVCKLDYHGRLIWMQISSEIPRKEFVFAIDGVCYRTIIPDKMISEEKSLVTIVGPFESVIAEALREHAPTNYKFFHPDD